MSFLPANIARHPESVIVVVFSSLGKLARAASAVKITHHFLFEIQTIFSPPTFTSHFSFPLSWLVNKKDQNFIQRENIQTHMHMSLIWPKTHLKFFCMNFSAKVRSHDDYLFLELGRF